MSGPLNGNLKELAAWLARILVVLLGWLAVDNLGSLRAEQASLRAELATSGGRITVLETLRPGDRQLLEQVAAETRETRLMVAKLFARSGAE